MPTTKNKSAKGDKNKQANKNTDQPIKAGAKDPKKQTGKKGGKKGQ